MRKTYWFILGLLIILLVVGVFWQVRRFLPVKKEVLPLETPTEAGGKTQSVKLYFASEKGTTLTVETREITAVSGELEQARLVIQELIAGPFTNNLGSTIPPGTKLREIYLDGNGGAYVDFSREIQDNHPGGSTGEMLTIFSVVNTLIENFPPIKKVQILVEGKEISTLAGHIDTSMPFKKNEEIFQDTSVQGEGINP